MSTERAHADAYIGGRVSEGGVSHPPTDNRSSRVAGQRGGEYMASQTRPRDIFLCPDVPGREVAIAYTTACERNVKRSDRERERLKCLKEDVTCA